MALEPGGAGKEDLLPSVQERLQEIGRKGNGFAWTEDILHFLAISSDGLVGPRMTTCQMWFSWRR